MKHKFNSIGRVAIALVLALSLSLVMAVPVSAAGALIDPSATPADSTAGETTTYTIAFTTANPGNVDEVVMVFDADFTVSGVGVTAIVTGIGAGTVGYSAQEVTYTVTDPALIPAGRAITIALTDIVNPGVADDYAVAITTKVDFGDIDTGQADVTITPKPLSFSVVANVGGPDNTVTAGVAFSVTVTAKDTGGGGGEIETGYTGDHLIDFSYDGSSAESTIPSFEMINFIAGEGTSTSSFILTLVETGKKITALDDALTVTGTSAEITINPTALDSFTITGAPSVSVTAGAPFTNPIIVTAKDADGNTVEDYLGTVSWSSTDPSAELPDPYTFVADDSGTTTFLAADFTLKTVLLEDGSSIDTTITVTGDGVYEDASITVEPATATQWTVVAAPTSIRADNVNASTITATAYDEFDNVATGKTGSANFSTSLGEITATDTFTAGVATATLKSDEVVGTATILVEDSGTLPDTTLTVTLVAPDLLAEVWVATDGDDANSGTEAAPFATIPAAIDAAAEGGTVNVAAGTYSAAGTIDKQLTLKGANYGVSAVTGDRGPESIIDGGAVAVEISASGVILDGFMIAGDDGGSTYRVRNEPGSVTDGVQIRNNIIIPGANLGIFTWTGSGTASNWVISNNTVAADGSAIILRGGGTNNTISDNLIGAGGITISDTMANITIENNTISNTNDGGSGVSLAVDADGVTITGNTFSGDLLNGNGVRIWSGATKVSTYAIHQNNFISDFGVGTGFAVNNETVDQVDATDNWWGDDSGPEHVLNPDGTGEPITGTVNYTPYLDAPYAEPVDPVEPVTTIDLVVGWNLISLPLYIPLENRAPVDLLAGVAGVHIVWGNYNPTTGEWDSYNPAEEINDLTAMRDGKGYWVDMTAADVLDVSILGTELPEAPNAPPTYDVVEGWNLIGFKSSTAKTASTYLAAIADDYTIIYGFADGAYFAVQAADNLEPGYGYWIAVTLPGTIYP